MAVPLTWPGRYHFYPIGSHSALCLTRDLPPEQDTNILLLPCGDPRNVLYTVFTEATSIRRILDFTCCDYDAGVLARNVLLLSMIMENVSTRIVWSVYLDMYLNDETLSAFTAHCRKLVEQSKTMEAWRISSYGSTLRMGTDLTLSELRRYWSLYFAAATAVNDRALAMRQLMDNSRKRVFEEFYSNGHTTFSTGRSAGPLFLQAFPIYTKQLHQYWKTGITSSAAAESANAASHVNPTFLYSKAGEGFAVQHGVDPLAPFHLSHVIGNDRDTPTPHRLTASALEEFHNWCDAFRARVVAEGQQLVVRFVLGDVLAVSQALQTRNERATSQPLATLVAPWTSQVFQLSDFEYDIARAPTRFDAIDTSNICDYIGLVNILLSSVPLLAKSPSSGILYTESFVAPQDDSDPIQQLQAMLVADLATHSLLFGVAPLGALSGFTSQCDTHELLQRQGREWVAGRSAPQQHLQMIAWRRPWTADSQAAATTSPPALIELSPEQLCPLLFHVYNRLFGAENPFNRVEANRGARVQPLGVLYTRETFVLFLRFLRPRLCLTEAQWSETLNMFLDLQRSTAIAQNVFDGLSHREFITLLYRYRLLTLPGFEMCSRARSGRLLHWTAMPPLVRVYLIVPADRLAVLRQFTSTVASPPLHCVVKYPRYEHISQSVHAVFGRVVNIGTPSNPMVAVQAEDNGFGLPSTTSPLVLSFVIPPNTLTDAAPETVFIRLSVRTTPATVPVFTPVLGADLSIFSACLEDTEHVHVVPENRLPPPPPVGSSARITPTGSVTIGGQRPIYLELGQQEAVATLTARLLVENATAKAAFSGGALPTISQTSRCAMRVVLGSLSQNLVFPVPVVGSQHKARLARKSFYIEVIVPVAIPALGNPDGMKLDPFPIVRTGDALAAWNMHRVNLDQLPMLDTESPGLERWFNTHVSTHFSEREGKMKRRETTPDAFVLLKDTIHYLLNKVAGLPKGPPKRVFALRDNATNDSDTLFFVHGLRYDLACHTVVCDAYVLPLFPELMLTLRPWFTDLVNAEITNTRTYEGESCAWKQLLPALAERCRTAWSHGPNCEYVAKGRIPLCTEVNGGDPLCSCGRGKDVAGMHEVDVWRPFAPLVTRIALSPLFAVSYLEHVLPRPASDVRPLVGPPPVQTKPARQCKRCHKTGPPEVKKCGRCGAVTYCSKACQRADWASHKPACATRK